MEGNRRTLPGKRGLFRQSEARVQDSEARIRESNERFEQMRAEMRESSRQTDEQLRSLALTVGEVHLAAVTHSLHLQPAKCRRIFVGSDLRFFAYRADSTLSYSHF